MKEQTSGLVLGILAEIESSVPCSQTFPLPVMSVCVLGVERQIMPSWIQASCFHGHIQGPPG